MSDAGTKPTRVSLTKKQLETELGAELLSLCQGITSDGTLTGEELNDLRAWLDQHTADDLPAIAHLRQVMARILEDGKITPDEVNEVHQALEAVLPVELRKSAKESRRQRERDEREKNRPIDSANFMVAGARFEGRPEIIRRYVNAGDAAILKRDRGNKHSRNAIAVYATSGHQVGFMPEEDAAGWAGDMDKGAKVDAVFTKVLTGGRSPIPVVQARLYQQDAAIDVPDVTPVAGLRTLAMPKWLAWLILIIAVVWWMTANFTRA